MSMILDIGRGLLCELFGRIALLIGPFTVFFAGPVLRTDTFRVVGDESGQACHVDRRALPRWLWWFQTPDEMLPGALYEGEVIRWLSSYGWRVCAALWLFRNAGYGFAWWLGRPADGYLDAVDGLVRRGALWRWKRVLGPIALQVGWKVHRANFAATPQAGPFRAIPFVSIRLKGNS